MAVDPTLFENLRVKSPEIAEVYRGLMSDKTQIDPDGVVSLFNQALADPKQIITEQEAEALSMIVNARILSDSAKQRLRQILFSQDGVFGFGRGGKLLESDTDLDLVFRALGLATLHVNFQSPRTGLPYNANAYEAIKRLVKSKKIHIVALQDHDLYWDAGMVAQYNSIINVLLLTSHAKEVSIVHEMTHAIQDWNDIKGIKTNYVEADAYIAEGVVFRKQGGRLRSDHPFTPAVNFVVDRNKDAQYNNREWSDIYDQAAAAYEPLRIANFQPALSDMTLGEARTGEKKQLMKLIDDIVL